MNIASCNLRLSFDVTANEITFEVKEDDETVWNIVRKVALLDCDMVDEIVSNEGGGGGNPKSMAKSTKLNNPSSTPLTNLKPTLFKVRKNESGGYVMNHPAVSVGNTSNTSSSGTDEDENIKSSEVREIACGLFAGTTFSGSSINATFTDFKIEETSSEWEKVEENDTVEEVAKQRLDLESLD